MAIYGALRVVIWAAGCVHTHPFWTVSLTGATQTRGSARSQAETDKEEGKGWLVAVAPGSQFPTIRQLSAPVTPMLRLWLHLSPRGGPFVLIMQLSRALTGSTAWMKQADFRTCPKDL